MTRVISDEPSKLSYLAGPRSAAASPRGATEASFRPWAQKAVAWTRGPEPGAERTLGLRIISWSKLLLGERLLNTKAALRNTDGSVANFAAGGLPV